MDSGADKVTKAELREEFETQNKAIDTKFKSFEADFKDFKADFKAHEAKIEVLGAQFDAKLEKAINKMVISTATVVGVIIAVVELIK